MYIYVHKHIHAHLIHICIHAYIHVYIHTCKKYMYIYMYIFINIYNKKERERTHASERRVPGLHAKEKASIHKLQVIFRKRATNYRALLRQITYEDKASYDSTPLVQPSAFGVSFLQSQI